MTLLQIALSGLLVGGVYAIVAVGISLVFGVMRIVNFAHGDLMMWGMYLVALLFGTIGLYPYLGGLVAGILLGVVGWLLARVLLNRFMSADHSLQIVVTLAIALILQALARLVFGGDRIAVTIEPFGTSSIAIGDLRLSSVRLAAFLVAAATAVALSIYLKRTWSGRALRAVSEDPGAARALGISPERMYALALGLGTGVAGIGAAMLVTIYPVEPEIGTQFMLISFVIVVLGGLGNVVGALVAGLVVGVVEAVTGYLWGQSYAQAVVFALFLLVLVVRPKGLFRGAY